MPIDSRIPLLGSPGINLPAIASAGVRLQESQARSKVLGLQAEQAQLGLDEFGENKELRGLERLNKLDQEEIKSVVQGAIDLKPFLDANDWVGALASVTQRREFLLEHDRTFDQLGDTNSAINKIENILATPQTSEPLKAQLKTEVDAIIAGGERFLKSTAQSPANVREFEFFNALPPDQQAQYLQVKRATGQFATVGGVGGRFDKESGGFAPAQTSTGPATLGGEVQAAAAIAGAKGKATKTGEIQAQVAGAEALAVADVEAKRIAGAPDAIAAARAKMVSIDQTMDEVADAIGLARPGTTGYGSFLKFIPQTDARLLRSKIDTIKAKLAFSELQSMRDLSKTGGALGQVSERELNLLESALVSLDQGLDDESLRKNFQKIIRHYNNTKFVLQRIIDVNEGRLNEADAQEQIDLIDANRANNVLRYDAQGKRIQ